MLNDRGFASDHHAVATFQPPDAAARPDIHIVDAFGSELFSTTDIVDIIGVSAIDEDVAARQKWEQIVDCLIDHSSGDHQPDGSGGGEFAYKIGKARAPRGIFGGELGDGLGGAIEDHALVAVLD